MKDRETWKAAVRGVSKNTTWLSDRTPISAAPSPFILLLPSFFPSIRVFSNELSLHIRWSKESSFSFSISPSNEYLGLISFRIAWFDLLAVQETLKSLVQHHNSKASILHCSAFLAESNSHNHTWPLEFFPLVSCMLPNSYWMDVKSFHLHSLHAFFLQNLLKYQLIRKKYWSSNNAFRKTSFQDFRWGGRPEYGWASERSSECVI